MVPVDGNVLRSVALRLEVDKGRGALRLATVGGVGSAVSRHLLAI